MTYRKLRISRNRYLFAWMTSLVLVISVAVLGFVDPLTDKLISEPNYALVFTSELAHRYHQVTGYTAFILHDNNAADKDDQTISKVLEEIRADGEPKNTAKSQNSNSETLAKFVSSKNGVTRFTIDYGNQQVSVMHLMYVPEKADKKAPTWMRSWSLPQRADLVFGSAQSRDVIPVDHVIIDLAALYLDKLHWRSNEDPDFAQFNFDLKKLNTIEGRNLTSFVDERMVSNMREQVGRKHFFLLFFFRWVLLPMFGFSLVFHSLLLWGWYRNYLREFNLTMLPPGFFTFVFTWDLAQLTKSLKFRLAHMKLEELKTRARRTIKPGLDNRPRRSGTKIPLSQISIQTGDPKEVQIKRVDQLFNEFQSLSEISEDKSEAWSLYEQALLSDDLAVQRDLLTSAIRELKRGCSKPVNITPSSQASTAMAESPTVYIVLENQLGTLFPVPEFLPKRIDGRMIREILIALLDPGKDVNLFGSNYRPGDALKRMVDQRYRSLKLLFLPTTFKRALKWLVKHGVVVSKPKTAELTYALSSNLDSGLTPEARELIRTVKQVNDKLTK